MLNRGDSVIVALSGGADSVSLLHIMKRLGERLELNIYAAHLNHKIRGEEADRDERFCKILCENYNVELFTKSVDIPTLAKQRKLSEELCGRLERYRFFDELSQKLGAKVATAHTASDNAETVLFNLIRGTGLRGMSGIAPVRDNIIRPLIYVTRDEVEAYCKENDLDYVTDSTNLSNDYTRNKIRHNIVSTCREINPNFERNIAQNSALTRDVNSFLELKSVEAEKLIKVQNGYSCDKITSLPMGLRDELLYFLLKKNNIEADYRTIDLLSQAVANHTDLDINNKTSALCTQGVLRFIKKDNKPEFSDKELNGTLSIEYNGKNYSFTELKSENNIVIRTRRAGDTFTFKNRKITKTLKKLLIEQKIPKEKRDTLLLAASDSTVLWLEGVGYSQQGEALIRVEINNT